jgi:hypothetical protein
MLEVVSLAPLAKGDGVKRAEQSKTQRKTYQTKFQSNSPLHRRLPGSTTRGITLGDACYYKKNKRFWSDE